MTRKSGWAEAAIAFEDQCRSNEVLPCEDVSESISNTNFDMIISSLYINI